MEGRYFLSTEIELFLLLKVDKEIRNFPRHQLNCLLLESRLAGFLPLVKAAPELTASVVIEMSKVVEVPDDPALVLKLLECLDQQMQDDSSSNDAPQYDHDRQRKFRL